VGGYRGEGPCWPDRLPVPLFALLGRWRDVSGVSVEGRQHRV